MSRYGEIRGGRWLDSGPGAPVSLFGVGIVLDARVVAVVYPVGGASHSRRPKSESNARERRAMECNRTYETLGLSMDETGSLVAGGVDTDNAARIRAEPNPHNPKLYAQPAFAARQHQEQRWHERAGGAEDTGNGQEGLQGTDSTSRRGRRTWGRESPAPRTQSVKDRRCPHRAGWGQERRSGCVGGRSGDG